MIISASRRTDIPALYPEWMLARLKAGFVLTPSPYNTKRLTQLEFGPDTVDCIVFWSKNPEPFMRYLPEVQTLGYQYTFQFTLTPYGRGLESGLPDKAHLVRVFRRLADIASPERVTWRYDPIVCEAGYDGERHLQAFATLAQDLEGATQRCVFSFADNYAHLPRKFLESGVLFIRHMAEKMLAITTRHGMALETCCEAVDLDDLGVRHSACISKPDMERMVGCSLNIKKAVGQRAGCRCVESHDIGVYNSCTNGCVYCYATRGQRSAAAVRARHDPLSPMLIGHPAGDEEIVVKRPPSCKTPQGSLLAL